MIFTRGWDGSIEVVSVINSGRFTATFWIFRIESRWCIFCSMVELWFGGSQGYKQLVVPGYVLL